MGADIAEMSSASTWHTGMKTAFETKNMKSKYLYHGDFRIMYEELKSS